MLLPSQLAAMRLGVHAGWRAPAAVAGRAAATLVATPVAWSRIMDAPRVAGHNDQVGDCVETGSYNAVQTAMADETPQQLAKLPDAQVVALYSYLTGYVAGNPATDQGTDPDVMFTWWRTHAIQGYGLQSCEAINPKDLTDIRGTIARAGGVAVVLALAAENQNQRVLTPIGTPGSWGSHFVWLDGYEGRLLSGTSWGEPFYLDETYFTADGFVLAAWELALKKVAA